MIRYDRPRQALAIALAGLAGFVDATGFLANGGYFVSFMSGNTTRLAVNLAAQPARAVMPALLIAGFFVGVTGGALLAERGGRWRKVLVLTLVSGLLLIAALAGIWRHHALHLAAMVLAMGALNNTFQRDGEVAVGLTYMTGALVRAGQGLAAALMGRRGGGWALHLLLWLGLAGGAVLGAVVWLRLGEAAAWAACGWAFALALVSAWLIRRDQRSS